MREGGRERGREGRKEGGKERGRDVGEIPPEKCFQNGIRNYPSGRERLRIPEPFPACLDELPPRACDPGRSLTFWEN